VKGSPVGAIFSFRDSDEGLILAGDSPIQAGDSPEPQTYLKVSLGISLWVTQNLVPGIAALRKEVAQIGCDRTIFGKQIVVFMRKSGFLKKMRHHPKKALAGMRQ